MASEKTSAPENTPPAPEKKARQQRAAETPQGRVKVWTGLALLLCLVIFALHVLFDKFSPYTGSGRIQAYVIPIVPQVSGTLTEVNVDNNEFVTEDQVLALIDSSKYELAVEQAQVNLQLATQTSEVDVAAVAAAQARVAEAEANLSNAQVRGQRVIRLAERGAASQSRADDARSKIESSKAKLASALSEPEKAKNKLGGTGISVRLHHLSRSAGQFDRRQRLRLERFLPAHRPDSVRRTVHHSRPDGDGAPAEAEAALET